MSCNSSSFNLSGEGNCNSGVNHCEIGRIGARSQASIDARNSFSTGVGTCFLIQPHNGFVEIGFQLVAQLGVAQQVIDFIRIWAFEPTTYVGGPSTMRSKIVAKAKTNCRRGFHLDFQTGLSGNMASRCRFPDAALLAVILVSNLEFNHLLYHCK